MVMSGGVQTRIRELAPKAVYTLLCSKSKSCLVDATKSIPFYLP